MNKRLGGKGDASCILAEHVVRTKYDGIPSEVVSVVKKSVLDTLGVSLAATTMTPGCKEIVELIREAGGKEESTIIGFGGRAPVWMAAFINGALVHGLDYDDMHYDSLAHPSGQAIPPAFAVAERVGQISGKEFITAIALGQDIAIRMSLSTDWHHPKNKFSAYTVIGVFSAAATCGKLLKLNEDKMSDAIGIANCYSAGTRGIFSAGGGSNLRLLYDAFPCHGGVLAALMAEKGITSPKNSLEGKYGFFDAFYQGEYDRDVLIGDLGKRFENAGIGYKPWPSCGNTHSCIDATLSLVKEHDISPKDIEEIIVVVSDSARRNCEPLEERRKPETPAAASWSIPFTVAVAAVKRRVVFSDFIKEATKDQGLLDLAQRVVPKIDIRFNDFPGATPCIVDIKMKDGQRYSKQVDFPYGSPRNPMTMKDIVRKFEDCNSHSVKPLSQGNIERLVHMTSTLEKANDVSQIIRLLG